MPFLSELEDEEELEECSEAEVEEEESVSLPDDLEQLGEEPRALLDAWDLVKDVGDEPGDCPLRCLEVELATLRGLGAQAAPLEVGCGEDISKKHWFI